MEENEVRSRGRCSMGASGTERRMSSMAAEALDGVRAAR